MKNRNFQYYLFEFLLVFIAIMVALVLNNWWQGIKQSNLEEKYLTGLKADNEKNITALRDLEKVRH